MSGNAASKLIQEGSDSKVFEYIEGASDAPAYKKSENFEIPEVLEPQPRRERF